MAISNWFFRFGVLAVLIGVCLGVWMGKEEDFTLGPVHAHLNLLGFVAMFLYGFFYRGFPAVAGGLIPKLHFGLSVLGVLMMIPSLGMVLLNGPTPPAIGALIGGQLCTVLGMLIFAIQVFRGTGKAPAPAE